MSETLTLPEEVEPKTKYYFGSGVEVHLSLGGRGTLVTPISAYRLNDGIKVDGHTGFETEQDEDIKVFNRGKFFYAPRIPGRKTIRFGARVEDAKISAPKELKPKTLKLPF